MLSDGEVGNRIPIFEMTVKHYASRATSDGQATLVRGLDSGQRLQLGERIAFGQLRRVSNK